MVAPRWQAVQRPLGSAGRGDGDGTQPHFNRDGALTRREQEVIVGVANGMTTKQIATSLGISFKTAQCHRMRLMQKLHLHSTAEVVRDAVRCGLVEA